MKIGIVYPVHNALEYVKRSLAQIRTTLTDKISLVIVNDASDQETSRYIHLIAKEICSDGLDAVVLDNKRQQLFTRTVNRGVRFAVNQLGAEMVAVVNTDCDLLPGWLEYLAKGFIDSNVAMVGYQDQPDQEAWKKKTYTEVRLPSYVTGHCFGLRVSALREVGLLMETDLDGSYVLPGLGRVSQDVAPYKGQAHIASERILCWRFIQAGKRCLYCHAPKVYHEAGKSWGHDLQWLSNFDLRPLWQPTDTLDEPKYYEE